jgi:hypothetical protein
MSRASGCVLPSSRSERLLSTQFNYPQYFVMIPTGPHPHLALTEGFFQVAGHQNPKPETVAIIIADAPFSQSPAQGAKHNLARQGMRVVFEGKYPLSTRGQRSSPPPSRGRGWKSKMTQQGCTGS